MLADFWEEWAPGSAFGCEGAQTTNLTRPGARARYGYPLPPRRARETD